MKILNSRLLIGIQVIMAIVFIIQACTSGTSKVPAPCAPPTGKFVNATVLGKCPDKMPVDVPHFCLELNFWDNDSVLVFACGRWLYF